MQVESDGNALLFEWAETDDGEVISRSDRATTTPTGLTISLDDVLPGDAGTLGIRLSLRGSEDSNPSVDPSFGFDLRETAENDRTEPGIEAGDPTANQGELQEDIDVNIRYEKTALRQ